VLRPGGKFHNGDSVTTEDVKFSFERYRGSSAKMIKDGVAGVETPDGRHIRFRLKEPWPDFLTYYACATGAGWIVPIRREGRRRWLQEGAHLPCGAGSRLAGCADAARKSVPPRTGSAYFDLFCANTGRVF
jgi:MarR-like DNA-binding transcriptional regulator SgrR of sgrS sRNA